MKPLNQAERRKALLNFLLFFIITMVVVITTVFFSMKVPFEENKKMKQQIIAYQTDQQFSDNFSARISDLQTLIDTIDKPNVEPVAVYNRINSILADLQAQKDKAVSGNDNIYAKTLQALYKLGSTKYILTKSGTQLQDYNKLNQDNQNLTQRINQANSYIIQLSTQVGLKPPFQSF